MIRDKLTFKNLYFTSAFIVILKIIYILIIRDKIFGIEDYAIAKNIVKHHQYSEFIELGGTAYKLPVYPYFISFFLWIFGEKSLISIAIFQALLSFVYPILIYRILNFFSLEKAGILAGFLFLLSPSYFVYSSSIEATNVFLLIILLWFYIYFEIWFKKNEPFYYTILLAFATALLFLTQVIIVPLVLIMIAGLFIFKKLNLRRFLILASITTLLYSPWVVRNYYVFDKFIPSKTPSWQNIYLGFSPEGQLLKGARLVSVERDNYIYSKRYKENELKMEEIYKKEVISITKNNPSVFLKKAVGNFIALWYVPLKYWDNNSLPILFGRKVYVILLNVLTLISLFVVYKKNKPIFWFSLLFFFNFMTPYLIGHASNIRFKLDFEWYQLILISYLLLGFSEKIKKSHLKI